MNFIKFKLIFFLVVISKNLSAQSNIDSFINTLHNADAKSVIAWVAPRKTFDSGRIYGQTAERVVTSIKVIPIMKAFPKYLLISKLFQSLDDPERDWYVDLLLYSLTGKSTKNIFGCSTREQW